MRTHRRIAGIGLLGLSIMLMGAMLTFYVKNQERIAEASYRIMEIDLSSMEDLMHGRVYSSGGNLYITGAGCYTLSGMLKEHQIVVNAGQEDVQLFLNGVTVQNTDLTAIDIKSAGWAEIILEEDSQNNIVIKRSDTEVTGKSAKSIPAILSENELTKLCMKGEGSLHIETMSGDGIAAEGELFIEGGNIEICTNGGYENGRLHVENGFRGFGGLGKDGGRPKPPEGGLVPPKAGMDPDKQEYDRRNISQMEAGESISYKGIKADKQLMIQGGSLTLNCADDALHSNSVIVVNEGSLNIRSGDDGIHADECISIEGGEIAISESYEGIEGKKIYISGGIIDVTSSDDGMNASSGETLIRNDQNSQQEALLDESLPLLQITGGTIQVDSEGDGLDSNGNLIIDGGDIIVDGPENGGNSALDSGFESGGRILIHCGTIIALGDSKMAEVFDEDSTQAFFGYLCEEGFEAEDIIQITDAQGNEIYSYTAKKSGDSIIFSSRLLPQDKGKYQVRIIPAS